MRAVGLSENTAQDRWPGLELQISGCRAKQAMYKAAMPDCNNLNVC